MSVDGYIKQITDNTSISLAQKNDCLKTLGVVLKNLVDASKGGLAGDAGLKYRTLKLDNPKLSARLFCVGCVRDLLMDASLVGMIATESTLVMTKAPSPAICDAIGLKVIPCVSAAQRQIASKLEGTTTTTASKKARLTEHNGKPTITTITTSMPEKLSEKQKARLLLEKKAQLEKEREKAFRKETRAKIAADKLVREKDENWKPTVSAAADKTGTGLLTFRDRHGE